MPYMSFNPVSRSDPVPPSAAIYNLYDRVGGPVDDDDYLHEPDAQNMKLDDTSWRGVANVTGMCACEAAVFFPPYSDLSRIPTYY